MDQHTATTELLALQCARYPLLRPQDLLKALHQSVFGPGHFVADRAAALALLQQELSALRETDGPDVEELGGAFCRVHLRYLERSGLSPQTLLALFALSAEEPRGSETELEKGLAALSALAGEGRLPCSPEEITEAVEAWRREGFPARRHSEAFRAAYAPAYRVIRREFVRLLPLLAAMDRALAKKGRVIAAIEGGAGSGKTTLAALLANIYDCAVFHMDDFFLRPEQRTQERLAEPGGNIDWERFLAQALLPLTKGEPVRYRRYDCASRTLLPPTQAAPRALTVVEGAYSMHPALAGYYDLSVFLRIAPALQRTRIQMRNGPETAARFFSQWIPMEQAYFEAFDTAGRCDLILEVEA